MKSSAKVLYMVKVKRKVCPITCHGGTQGDSAHCRGHVGAALPPEKRTCANCIGAWVSTSAGLDGSGKYCRHKDLISGPSSPL